MKKKNDFPKWGYYIVGTMVILFLSPLIYFKYTKHYSNVENIISSEKGSVSLEEVEAKNIISSEKGSVSLEEVEAKKYDAWSEKCSGEVFGVKLGEFYKKYEINEKLDKSQEYLWHTRIFPPTPTNNTYKSFSPFYYIEILPLSRKIASITLVLNYENADINSIYDAIKDVLSEKYSFLSEKRYLLEDKPRNFFETKDLNIILAMKSSQTITISYCSKSLIPYYEKEKSIIDKRKYNGTLQDMKDTL